MPIALEPPPTQANHRIRLAPGDLRHLRQAFVADHALEIAHQHRIRMRAGNGPDDVEGAVDVGDPVAHGFVQRILERLRSRFDRDDGRSQQLHPEHVLNLPLDVDAAHVHDAFEPVTRRHGCRGDAMHPGSGLRDDAGLAEPVGEQRLSDAVVDLVRAGVVEVLALQVDLRAAQFVGPPLRVINRARAPDEVLQLAVEFRDESRGRSGSARIRRAAGRARGSVFRRRTRRHKDRSGRSRRADRKGSAGWPEVACA
jgi:hypothetical protein